jgi:hypothetical protein
MQEEVKIDRLIGSLSFVRVPQTNSILMYRKFGTDTKLGQIFMGQ